MLYFDRALNDPSTLTSCESLGVFDIANHSLNWSSFSNPVLRTPCIFSKDKIVLLEITIDKKVAIEAHIDTLCKKASYNLWVLQQIRKKIEKYLTVMQVKALASVFVNRQFNNFGTVWMFCGRKSKLTMENIHTRTLRVVYN